VGDVGWTLNSAHSFHNLQIWPVNGEYMDNATNNYSMHPTHSETDTRTIPASLPCINTLNNTHTVADHGGWVWGTENKNRANVDRTVL